MCMGNVISIPRFGGIAFIGFSGLETAFGRCREFPAPSWFAKRNSCSFNIGSLEIQEENNNKRITVIEVQKKIVLIDASPTS